MRGEGEWGPTSSLGGDGLSEGSHRGTRRPQPDIIERDTFMLEISRREGALQRLPTNIGVREEIFLDETLPRPSLCYGWGFTPWMTRKGTIEASTFGRGGVRKFPPGATAVCPAGIFRFLVYSQPGLPGYHPVHR